MKLALFGVALAALSLAARSSRGSRPAPRPVARPRRTARCGWRTTARGRWRGSTRRRTGSHAGSARPGLFSVTHGFRRALGGQLRDRETLACVDPRSGPRAKRPGRRGALRRRRHLWARVGDGLGGREARRGRPALACESFVASRSDARPTGLHVAGGSLWVGFGRSATAVARVDPKSMNVERVPVGVRAPSWFVAGANGLWIQAADNVLVHVERRPRRRPALVRAHARAGRARPRTGRSGSRTRSRASSTGSTPSTARVLDSFAAGPGAFLALRAYGSMWVTSYAGEDVWRFRP